MPLIPPNGLIAQAFGGVSPGQALDVDVEAQLAGFATVFGNQAMTVTFRPANQDLLPGFGVQMLAAPDDEGDGDE